MAIGDKFPVIMAKEKDVANGGVPTLDANGKIKKSQIPDLGFDESIATHNNSDNAHNDIRTLAQNAMAAAEAAQNTADEAKGDANIQPDLSINDESNPAYVKNRTHYDIGSSETETVLINNVSVNIGEGLELDPFVLNDIKVGSTYSITWDGTVYRCIAYELEVNDGQFAPCIGNRRLIGYRDGSDEPFFIINEAVDSVSVGSTSSGTHEISISIVNIEYSVVKLPERFLPNSNIKSGEGTGAIKTAGATSATGTNAFAEGTGTRASRKSQHVEGEYNIADGYEDGVDARGNYVHVVGNGTSDTERSNAHTVDWQGNAWYAGDVYVGSTDGKNRDAGSVKLQKVIKGTKGQVVGFNNNGEMIAQDSEIDALKAEINVLRSLHGLQEVSIIE